MYTSESPKIPPIVPFGIIAAAAIVGIVLFGVQTMQGMPVHNYAATTSTSVQGSHKLASLRSHGSSHPFISSSNHIHPLQLPPQVTSHSALRSNTVHQGMTFHPVSCVLFAMAGLLGGLALRSYRLEGNVPEKAIQPRLPRWDPLAPSPSLKRGHAASCCHGRWAVLMALGQYLQTIKADLPSNVWLKNGSHLITVNCGLWNSATEHASSIAMLFGAQSLLAGAVELFERCLPTPFRPQSSQDIECCSIAMVAMLGSKLRKVKLGSSDLMVTDVCLGTMTWGVQNTEAEAHQQLDYAIKERGVNFLDTAEMYPVPTFAPEWAPGKTEEYIGTWLAKNPEWREKVIIATKVVGYMPSPNQIVANRTQPPQAPAPSRLDAASVKQACEGSLRRLQTDYIDLYQIHWPDRYVPIFGSTQYDPEKEWPTVPIKETVQALWDLIKEGKIRHYGLSNETTYGVCEWVRCADELGAPRPVSIQNSFCLLNRTFATELAEACAPNHYNIGLLPWTPLGGGALTGKYLDSAPPKGSRFQLYPAFMTRYNTPASLDAIRRYKAIADEAGISMATLALAWCRSRWYVASTIIGATDMEQLKEDIDAFTVNLTESQLKAIDEVHASNKDPALSL